MSIPMTPGTYSLAPCRAIGRKPPSAVNARIDEAEGVEYVGVAATHQALGAQLVSPCPGEDRVRFRNFL
jgi:hypothetical protein